MPKLKLADGIRAPRADEYPAGTDAAKIDALRDAANIRPGYRCAPRAKIASSPR